jgi:MFS family permease
VALGRGTLLFVITSITTLICAPFMGFLLDRFDRLMMLALGAVLATVGFGAVGLIENPLDPAVKPLFILLGIGQASCFYASQALIGQEAPQENRGAVIGAFSACGAIGVLIANGVGGRLFDSITPGAPFLMVACATALLAIFAVWVRLRERTQSH